MSILSNFTEEVTKAIDYVVEKNRKTALINRVKLVIKNEEQNADKAYIALGKYYYRNLRDAQNGDTEPLCCAVDTASQRMDRAVTKLEELTKEGSGADADSCSECNDDCDECPYFEDYDHQVSMKDLKEEGAEEEEEVQPAPGDEILHPELLWQDEGQAAQEPEPQKPADQEPAAEPAAEPAEKPENKEAADNGDGSAIPSDY